MKDLVIDIGNSYTKAGIFVDDTPGKTWSTDKLSLSWLESLQKELQPDRAILSNVGQEYNFTAEFLNGLRFSIELDHKTRLPINNLYKTPETLGKDRLALIVGAHFLYPQEHVLVMDAGSCLTYDIIDSSGNYYGGAISPGLKMRFRALHQFTGRLPVIEPPEEIKLTGATTAESISSGVVNGMVNEIEGFVSEYGLQYPALRAVLSGGDANYLAKQLKKNIFVHQNLLLTGLHQILKHNAP